MEVSSGDTKTQLSVLVDIFSEIEESLQSSEENVSNKIISSIKCIMSDRHIVQKKFSAVFQNYRASVLQQYLKIGIHSVKTFKKILMI